jgi:diguanylate cyclase (GGDEF)-like protein/PAS domain S-box-containing protein
VQAATASVLAVDDNATIRRAIAMRLGSKGYHVITAENGQKALAALDTHEFDLILLDLQMPGMSGNEVLRQVRSRYSGSQLPVIMLAASDDKLDIAKTFELGANDYVVKPGEFPALLARINTQLSLRKTTRRVFEQEATINRVFKVLPTAVRLAATATPSNSRESEPAWQFEPTDSLDRRFNVLYDNTPMICFTLNHNLEVLFANRFGIQFLGYLPTDIRSRSLLQFYAESDQDLAENYLRGALEQPERLHRWEIRRLKKNGDIIWMRETARVLGAGADALILMTCEDIDDTYRLAEKVAFNAAHDELTGLANRKTLEARLHHVIDSAHSEHRQHALAIVDIDQFKIINDTCGHAAGDELLKQTAKILSDVVRKHDTVARVGGDEFGVLFEDCALSDATAAAETVREVLASYLFEWRTTTHRISASVGLVGIDRTCEGVTAALSMADMACYAAKDAGRNRIHVYHTESIPVLAKQGEMRWVTRINDAFRENRFQLSLQPIVPVGDPGKLGDHYEVLLRMRDETGNIILPGQFLHAAERYNLATNVDRWVIRHTLEWLASDSRIFEQLHLCGINLSGQSFGDPGILNFIVEQLDHHSPRIAEKLCFEVTETAALSDIVQARHFMGALKDRGCSFALDDFGSGFSSFSYLKNLPVDFLKIDGSFVREMVKDPVDLAMVRSINQIGHVMGKQTIAEFVEDDAILGMLGEVGVDYAQGYAIGRPQAISDFVLA